MRESVPLGTIIATRELEFVCEGGERETVVVSIGVPVVGEDAETWYCPYRVKGMSFEKQRHTVGIDSVQALDLALGVIGSELIYISRHRKGVFQFLGEPGHAFRLV